jgi:hypothetical protein
MESLLEPVELNRETTQALDEIRSGAANELYGTASTDAEEKVNRYVLPLIEGSGLPGLPLHVMHYRWFLRELARHWRTRKGRDLAFHLELCIRKWVGLGLEPRTLQFLICEAHERLKGKDLTTKHALSEVEGTPSHQEEPDSSPVPVPQSLIPEQDPSILSESASARNPNLPESVESVDNPPAPASAESVEAS